MTRRATWTSFSCLTDCSVINALTLWTMIKEKDDITKIRRAVCPSLYLDLINSLVKPFVQERSVNGLQTEILVKRAMYLDPKSVMVKPVEHQPQVYRQNLQTQKGSRCYLCVQRSHGEGHKDNKPNSKPKWCCQRCGKNICMNDHAILQCVPCSTLPKLPLENPDEEQDNN